MKKSGKLKWWWGRKMNRNQKNGYSLYNIFSLILLDVLIDIKISAAIVLSVMI